MLKKVNIVDYSKFLDSINSHYFVFIFFLNQLFFIFEILYNYKKFTIKNLLINLLLIHQCFHFYQKNHELKLNDSHRIQF